MPLWGWKVWTCDLVLSFTSEQTSLQFCLLNCWLVVFILSTWQSFGDPVNSSRSCEHFGPGDSYPRADCCLCPSVHLRQSNHLHLLLTLGQRYRCQAGKLSPPPFSKTMSTGLLLQNLCVPALCWHGANFPCVPQEDQNVSERDNLISVELTGVGYHA